MTTKMKDVGWFAKPRAERLAQVLYPHLSDQPAQRQMLETAAVEGKQGQMANRITEGNKGYGKVSVAPSLYDRVPGLVRKSVEVKATKSWWEK